ncbi:pyroglutamyl-peptidase I [Streptomyces sp. TRM S81-3]|uniref:Pyroglutamyl-peptidase I n=1 Tax=Streptomyces griseicoloratus TaxID=2752516 RepID=A0A926L206_9ACTN|nr:pyroglutamyl-peptidase I [Streptomyces griseicoloratus]MBD0420440.1 pyroglutamyl-peptidase I [Streptomyces griseicoloratus]
MTRVLVTGFEPFQQDTYNPSWAAAQLLQDKPPAGLEVTAVQLPCVFTKSIPALRSAVLETDPQFVVCLGLSPRRGISIERVAINVDDSPGLDNDGQQPVDEPIVPDGPAAYFSTLPIKRCAAAVQQAGIYSEISLTAGTFVCNHVFYGLMHLLATEDKQRRGGFIHVPHTPEMPAVSAYGVPSMAVDTAAEGLRIVLTTVAAHDTDIKVPWGTTS